MEPDETTVRSSVDVACSSGDAFEAFVDELGWELDSAGLRFDPGPDGRDVREVSNRCHERTS